MRKRKYLAIYFILVFILNSCVIPEKYNVNIKIETNEKFTFNYDGILTLIPARMDELKKGKLSKKANKKIENTIKKMKQDKAFKSIVHIGHGKLKVLYEKKGNLDKPFYFMGKKMKLFSIKRNKKIIEFLGLKLKMKDIKSLSKLHLEIDGNILIQTAGVVLEHNANEVSNNQYIWKIKSISDNQPKILIKTNK